LILFGENISCLTSCFDAADSNPTLKMSVIFQSLCYHYFYIVFVLICDIKRNFEHNSSGIDAKGNCQLIHCRVKDGKLNLRNNIASSYFKPIFCKV
jgi:hypothetical protein